MEATTTTRDNQHFFKTLLLAWAIAGTLDITAATIQTLIMGGNPMKMFQYIASGVFGKDAFAGGTLYSIYGFVFHYIIAFGWTFLFFSVYPKIALLSKNVIATAVVYGIFVWTMMSQVVLKLSNVPKGNGFKLTSAIIAASILIIAIGLPLSIIARKYYSNRQV